ncbi:hypothetical protein ACIQC7_17425 [Kitasatospora sp. NPDC088556]|uniref:hypothetical protein n=1 Tax=Kitasatospora sp. NPDC088556 TaxID=3364076 RepID=UPI003824183C
MTTVTEDGLRTMLAERSGLDRDSLWYPVYAVPRDFNLTWPLTTGQADDVLRDLLDGLRRVLPAPQVESGPDGEIGAGERYVYLSEITDRYERCDTRRILERLHDRGITPARLDFGGEDWRMPAPYTGEGDPPVDRALALRERTGDSAAYRAALLAAVREDPRQIDCWAHLGNDALERADSDATALTEALGYFQTAVAVAELSLPPAFTGVLAWSQLDNRPFHRALHGLGLAWWRLAETSKAAVVMSNSLRTNPNDNQGVRHMISEVNKGTPWSRTAEN